MAILAFQKPDKVLMLETNSSFGKFEFRPLEPGYGITIGNALRRILLSSLEGYAISSVKIEGVEHEFASIPGVLEDVTNIILNLKRVRFKRTIDDPEGFEQESVTVSIAQKEVFKASDIGREIGGGFEVLNPELEICHLDPGASMQIVLTVNKGRGYVPADEHQTTEDLNVIAIDSIYTPIRNVKYTVENFRVEQKTDFEKLVVEISTDGSVHPKEALKESARILIQHFMLFSDDKIATETIDFDENEEFDEEALHMRQLLKTHLTEMDLSVRALNCLKSAEVATLGELVHYNKNDLLKFRNFGKKSLTELDDLLERLNLSFGMDIAKYKLDKD